MGMSRLAMKRPFSAHISRSLTLALGIILAVVMLVGGASLTLALRIYLSVEASAQEFGQILKLDQVHANFDDLILELQQINLTRHLDHTAVALLLQEEISRQLDALDETSRAQAGATEREQAVLADLHRLSEETRALTKRLSTTGRLAAADLDWLNRATHEVPRLTDELAGLHEFRITRLHESSEHLIQAIIAVYVVFTVVGGVLVVVAGFAASRRIGAPLHKLADAARGIAEGRLETRVSVRHANEIGLLAQTFNTMAERLQEHEREVRSARDALEQKVREVRALHHIGTEIARLQQLDRILQAVVDKARELLRCDAVVLRLFGPQGGDLVPPARSGLPEAAEDSDRLVATSAPEFAPGRLALPIRLGDAPLGIIIVSTSKERNFTADEAELLAALATQAANAIERVRLTEDIRNLAVLQERERLAREMHDGLAQELGLLHMKLYGALERLADGQAVADAMREMAHIADRAYEEVRQSIYGLRTFVSQGLGLVPALAEFLHEFSKEYGIKVELEVGEETFAQLSPPSEVQVIRIVQEALSNVRKHAHADHASVRLQREGNGIRVAIEDQGVGWDPLTSTDRLHFGLQGMRERAEGLGGRLQIDTAPGGGTRVIATVPGGGA